MRYSGALCWCLSIEYYIASQSYRNKPLKFVFFCRTGFEQREVKVANSRKKTVARHPDGIWLDFIYNKKTHDKLWCSGLRGVPPPEGADPCRAPPIIPYLTNTIFFQPPTDFHALNGVIDIIGDATGEAARTRPTLATSRRSSGYGSIKRLAEEEAIEHRAVKHCADLNSLWWEG